jgi:hypothetical protein
MLHRIRIPIAQEFFPGGRGLVEVTHHDFDPQELIYLKHWSGTVRDVNRT